MRRLVSTALPLALTAALSACGNDRQIPVGGASRDATARADASDAGTMGDDDATMGNADATMGNADATMGNADATMGNADALPGNPDAMTMGADALPMTMDSGTMMGGTYTESALAMPTFIDACATGTTLMLTETDDGHGDTATPLPFAFDFFGAPVSAVWASTNGYAVFDSEPVDEYSPAIPYIDEGAAIFALWQDLTAINMASAICIATTGAAPNRQLVIEWRDFASLDTKSPTELTFEIVLTEGTNTVDLIYQTLSATDPLDADLVNGNVAAIGLQTAMGGASVTHMGTIATTAGIRFTP